MNNRFYYYANKINIDRNVSLIPDDACLLSLDVFEKYYYVDSNVSLIK